MRPTPRRPSGIGGSHRDGLFGARLTTRRNPPASWTASCNHQQACPHRRTDWKLAMQDLTPSLGEGLGRVLGGRRSALRLDHHRRHGSLCRCGGARPERAGRRFRVRRRSSEPTPTCGDRGPRHRSFLRAASTWVAGRPRRRDRTATTIRAGQADGPGGATTSPRHGNGPRQDRRTGQRPLTGRGAGRHCGFPDPGNRAA